MPLASRSSAPADASALSFAGVGPLRDPPSAGACREGGTTAGRSRQANAILQTGTTSDYPFGALNLEPASADPPAEANLSEAAMTHWRNTMVDKPETKGAVYVAGWTISGLAVLAAVVAVWLFGI